MDGRRADDPDTPLVRAVAAGSEPALAELYDRHADAVFGASYRLLGQRQQAEEVVQETFLTLWNRAERFDPIVGSLRAWLMSICRNRSIDRLRADGRRPMIVPLGAGQADELGSAEALDRSLAGGTLVGAAPIPADPEEAAERTWRREAVRAALRLLPDQERRALELAYYGGLSQQEIAVRLGWPLGTVKTRMRRALQRLRLSLAETLGPERGAAFAPVPLHSDRPGGLDGLR